MTSPEARIARLEAFREADRQAARDFMAQVERQNEILHRRIKEGFASVDERLDTLHDDMVGRKGAAKVLFAFGTVVAGTVGAISAKLVSMVRFDGG